MKYSFWGGLFKAVVKGSAFALPLILTVVPEAWLNMTIGTASYLALDYLQKKYTSL